MLTKVSEQFSNWKGVVSFFKVDGDNSSEHCLSAGQRAFTRIVKLKLRELTNHPKSCTKSLVESRLEPFYLVDFLLTCP